MEGLSRTLLDIPRSSLEGSFAELDQKQGYRETQSECYETICWGCGLRLVLPAVVPVFKCGWCGAISNYDIQAKKQGWCLNCSHVIDRLLVPIIFTLIVLIIGGGVWAVFPVLCPDLDFTFFFHAALTGLLSFNTLFNYCVAAFVRAGPIPHTAWGNVDCVNKGGLEGHRFCSVCHKPKPPRAHHCRSCKACVYEMDHHCPFIGNCVGAANHRPFILFLLFAVLSNLYVFAMAVSAIIKIWRTTVDFPEMLGVVASSSQVVVMLATYLQALLGGSVSSSARALGLLYLVAVSLSVTIGVGLLLYQQVWQLYDGYTFIETLQNENGLGRGTPGRGWRNLQRVFGHGHPIFWVFPKLVSGSNGKVHDK